MEYLYKDGDKFAFMNTSTYEQEYVGRERSGMPKLPAGEPPVVRCFFTGIDRSADHPTFMNLRIVQGRPLGQVGTTASGGGFEAGHPGNRYVVQVPTFLEEGQLIKIGHAAPGATWSAQGIMLDWYDDKHHPGSCGAGGRRILAKNAA